MRVGLRSASGLAIALLMPLSASANLWECDVKGVYRTNDSGVPEPVEVQKYISDANHFTGGEVGEKMYFDEASGIVRRVSSKENRQLWELKFEPWQRGSSTNSAVAVFMRHDLRADPVMVIRVTAFQQVKKLTFLHESGDIVTGLCKTISPG